MVKRILTLMLVVILGFLSYPISVDALTPLKTSSNEAVIDFPNKITFRAQLQAEEKITKVVLEYGTTQLTCGDVIAKAFPQFTPGTSVKVEWSWDMRQSGSLPPGANIWWRWRVTDANGKESVSEQQNITWLDSVHDWQTLSAENLRLHWYEGSQSFADKILQAAKGGLALNDKSAGLKPEGAIDLYIYSNYTDLGDAILYEPSWTGGQAFPENNIVIIGISTDNVEWGKSATVHELTHVLVGHLTFSCLGDVPTWLNEGLAVYSEGQLELSSQQQLDAAIRDDTLLPVRSLSGGFSEIADKANLSYSESFSIVKFLLETYGQPKMTELLTTLRDGTTIDEALLAVYGFNVEGLEDAWRESIGAQARAAVPNPTATPLPTYVPTIAPISGVPLAVTSTPFAVPTSSTGGPATVPSAPALPGFSSEQLLAIAGVLTLLCCCLVVGLLIAGVVYFVLRGKTARRADQNGGQNA
jgi:hypothetical protein